MRPLVLAALLAASLSAAAQTVPPQGAPDTFDVAAWNVEWFGSGSNGPSDEARQQRNVLQTIREAEIDVWILEEIASQTAFDALLAGLGAEWAGARVASGGDQRIAVVYRTAVLPDAAVDIALTNLDDPANNSDGNLFAGRPPLRLRGTVTLPGRTPTPVTLLGVHLKASSDAASQDRRRRAADALQAYLNDLLSDGDATNDRALVLGDFNDRLDQSITVGLDTPFRALLNDPALRFLTKPLAEAGLSTYCSTDDACGPNNGTASDFRSTIDHMLATLALADDEVPGATARFDALLSIFGDPTDASTTNGFDDTTSDHLPILTRFAFPAAVAGVAAPAGGLALEPAAPNPFGAGTVLRVRLAEPSAVRLEAFDALGRRVAVLAEGPMEAGVHPVALDGRALAPGVYVVRLTAGAEVVSRAVVRR